MKVIDLLNKIANGEEVPKKIIYNTRIFTYNEYNKCYIWNCNGDEFYLSTYYRIEQILNEEVEIIKEEKDIEKIVDIFAVDHRWQSENNNIFKNKINELIDIVKELKNEKENN